MSSISTTADTDMPNSGSLEEDVRNTHGGHDASHPVAPGDIAIGVVIGRTSEFFDFFVYALASVLVFPRFLFPETPASLAMVYSFALFSLAFIARPIGSVIFVWLDRRHGRGVKLTVALLLLGSATAGIAFLPSRDIVGGYVVFLLGLFRFAQGLALGGAWDGLASLLSLNAPQHKRGWYAMLPQLGAPLGFLLAAGIFAFLQATLPAQDFQEWGWRYPFFVAFAINVVALFARLRLVVTREFTTLLEQQELQPVPIPEVLEAGGRNLVVGAFIPLACFALFHLVTVFPLAWNVLRFDRNMTDFLLVQMAGAGIMLVTTLFSGWLADVIGRRNTIGIGAILIGIYSFIAPFTLTGPDATGTGFVLVGFALLGLSFGQASGAVAANFGKRLRYTGSALVSDASWLIGAAFAPLVVLGLSDLLGVITIGGYLLSGVICTLGALAYNRYLELTT